MNKLDELEKLVENDLRLIEKGVISFGNYKTFVDATRKLIKVARAGQEIGREYLKCHQNPHNDPVVRWREIRRLVDALKELEK